MSSSLPITAPSSKNAIQDEKQKSVKKKSSTVNLVENVPTFIIDSSVPILSGSVEDIQGLDTTGSNPYPSMARPRKSLSALDTEIADMDRTSTKRSVSESSALQSTSIPLLSITPSDSVNQPSDPSLQKRSSSLVPDKSIFLQNHQPSPTSGSESKGEKEHTTPLPISKKAPLSSAQSPIVKDGDNSSPPTTIWKETASQDLTPKRPSILTNNSSSTSHRNVQVIESPNTSVPPKNDLQQYKPNQDDLGGSKGSTPEKDPLDKRQSVSSLPGSPSSKQPRPSTSGSLETLSNSAHASQGDSFNDSPQPEASSTPTIMHQSFSPLSPSTNISSRSRNASGQHVNYPNPMQGINFRTNDPNEWTLERVLTWLEHNKFGLDWIETFRSKNIHGAEFLSLVSYQKLKDIGHLSSSNDIYSTTPSRFIHILRKVFDRSSSTSNGTIDPQPFQSDLDEEDPISTYNTNNSIELFYNSEAMTSTTAGTGTALDSLKSETDTGVNASELTSGNYQDHLLNLPQTMRLPINNSLGDNISEIDPQQIRIRSNNNQLRPISTYDISTIKQTSPSSPTAFSNIFSRKHTKSNSSESSLGNPIQPTLSANPLISQEEKADRKTGLLNKFRRRDKDGNRDRLRASKSATNLFEVQNSQMNSMPSMFTSNQLSDPAELFSYGNIDVQYEPIKPKEHQRIMLVTTTNEHFTTINISDVSSLEELKLLIADKLNLNNWSHFTFHLTEFGCSEGQALDDITFNNLVFNPSRLGYNPHSVLKFFIGNAIPFGSISPGQLSMEYEFSTNTSAYPATPSYLIHSHPDAANTENSAQLQSDAEPPDYFSHKPLEQTAATSPQAPLLTQQQQISFQEYIRNINHHNNKGKMGSASARGSSKSNFTNFGTPANYNYNSQYNHFNSNFLHPLEDTLSFRDPGRLSVASIDYTGRRSSEDSFKVIRPERREINFDDRRSSPYDRRPSINPQSIPSRPSITSDRTISIPSISSSSSSSSSTLPLTFPSSNNPHVVNNSTSASPAMGHEETLKTEKATDFDLTLKNDTTGNIIDKNEPKSSEEQEKSEGNSETLSTSKTKINRHASIRTSRIYRSVGSEDARNSVLDSKSVAENNPYLASKTTEGKLSRQSSKLDRKSSVKLVPKRAAPPPPSSNASSPSLSSSLPKPNKTQLHRTTSVITRGSGARASSHARSNVTDSTGNLGYSISELPEEPVHEVRRVSDSAVQVSDSTGRKVSIGSRLPFVPYNTENTSVKENDLSSEKTVADNSLYGLKEEVKQTSSPYTAALGRQPSSRVSSLTHSLSRRSHRSVEDNEAKFHENEVSFADAPAFEESDDSGSSSDEGLWAKKPPKLTEEKDGHGNDNSHSDDHDNNDHIDDHGTEQNQETLGPRSFKTPVPMPPTQLRRLSQSLSTVTSPPPPISESPPPPLPTSSPLKLTMDATYSRPLPIQGDSSVNLQQETHSRSSSFSLSHNQKSSQDPQSQKSGDTQVKSIYQPIIPDSASSEGRPTLHVDVSETGANAPGNNNGKLKSATPMTPISYSDINMNGWAVRPPAEVVYENLERFFPNADLDRPIILDPQGMSPPASPNMDIPAKNHYLPPLSPVVEPHVSQDGSATLTSSSSLSIVSSSSDQQDTFSSSSDTNTLTVPARHNFAVTRNLQDSSTTSGASSPSSETNPRRLSESSTLVPSSLGNNITSTNSNKISSSSNQPMTIKNNDDNSPKLGNDATPKNTDDSSPKLVNEAVLKNTARTKSNEVDFAKFVKKTDPAGGIGIGGKNKLTMRTKSLRIVVQEATERRKRFQSLANLNTKGVINVNGPGGPGDVIVGGSPAALLRRKSTKVWGQKVVEVKPDEFRSGGQQLSRLRDNRGKVKQFVWVKGELIGKGTFGKVYLALNATAGEMIAVKQVEVPQTLSDKNSLHQKEVIDAFHAEVETMKDLDHFNIVQYLGFEALPDVYNLFLEYVPGGTVGMALRKHGRFEINVSQYFTRQVLDGLAYLHSCGILHRDLKSDNILIDLDGVCKISDFGISKKSRDIYANDAAMSMQGTIFWMAPEVIHNVIDNEKQGYSAKVDIWSLGCVVLEMFAGRRPWSTDEAIAAMYKLGNARLAPPIPEDTKPFVTEVGKNFLDLCFKIDPEQRPTAKELLDHEFCVVDPDFRFADTKLAKMIRVDDKEKKMKKQKQQQEQNKKLEEQLAKQ